MVRFVLWLYGKPAWDMELEGELDKDFSNVLRNIGYMHKEWLHKVADIYDELIENGWEAYGTLYDIDFYKNISVEKAEEEFKKLGLEEYIDCIQQKMMMIKLNRCWFDSNIECDYVGKCKCYPWSKECKRIHFGELK